MGEQPAGDGASGEAADASYEEGHCLIMSRAERTESAR